MKKKYSIRLILSAIGFSLSMLILIYYNLKFDFNYYIFFAACAGMFVSSLVYIITMFRKDAWKEKINPVKRAIAIAINLCLLAIFATVYFILIPYGIIQENRNTFLLLMLSSMFTLLGIFMSKKKAQGSTTKKSTPTKSY